jgi:hypothetical protein
MTTLELVNEMIKGLSTKDKMNLYMNYRNYDNLCKELGRVVKTHKGIKVIPSVLIGESIICTSQFVIEQEILNLVISQK